MQTELENKIVFLEGIPLKFLGRLECNFEKTDEIFFQNENFSSLEHEVKWNMTKFFKKNREVISTRRM